MHTLSSGDAVQTNQLIQKDACLLPAAGSKWNTDFGSVLFVSRSPLFQ